jgi:hypothetical protein
MRVRLVTAASSAVALVAMTSSCSADSVTNAHDDAVRAVTSDEANALLPNASVLGAGWDVREDFDQSSAGPLASPSSCQLLVDVMFSRPMLSPTVSKSRGYNHENTTLATVTVAGWRTAEDAADLLGQIQILTRTCSDFTVGSDNEKTTVHVEPTGISDLGDRAVAVRMTSTDDEDAAFYVSSLQLGPNTITTVSMSFGNDEDVTGKVLVPVFEELRSKVTPAG